MRHLAQAESSLLGLHHDEFDELLGEVCGVSCLLDFGHGDWVYGLWGIGNRERFRATFDQPGIRFQVSFISPPMVDAGVAW